MDAQTPAAAAVASPWFGRAMAALRIFFGVVFLHNGLAKVLPAIPNLWPNTPIGFVIQATGDRSAFSILQQEASHNPVEPYRALVENVVLPNFGAFGFGIGLMETVVGVLLILGLATSLAALLAAGMVLHLQFATLWNDKWIYEYSVEWLPLLCLAAFRAGRWHGLDARFAATRRRWPG
ncbi:MAG: DoxX family membrane protein [Candidatus Limnocylindrales bacterium]